MTFGEKLQELRRNAGLSQDLLAERLEVSRQAVSKWERDEAMPETEKVVRIAKLFDVSLDELLLDREPQPRQPEYQPYTPPAQPSGQRLEKFLRRHGYKSGYVLMAAGGLLCAFAILMRLIWPSLAGNFFDSVIPEPFGSAQWEIQIPDDVPDSVRQEIMSQMQEESVFGGIYGSSFQQMSSITSNALNAQANLFLLALLPGLTMLIVGIVVVVKGKKLSVGV